MIAPLPESQVSVSPAGPGDQADAARAEAIVAPLPSLDACADLERTLIACPVTLPRPVIILDGWHSPAFTVYGLARRLRRLTGSTQPTVSWITYPFAWSVDAAETRARRVLDRWGLLDREVDIIGFSMGGIVARMLAHGIAGRDGELRRPPLRVRRMFTLASPHRGAHLAAMVRPDIAARQLAAGSTLLRALDVALPSRAYDLTCYRITKDWMVGPGNTAPEGVPMVSVDPWNWFSQRFGHFSVAYSPQLVLDLARRLRAG